MIQLRRWLLVPLGLAAAYSASAQPVFDQNLILNGDAESGPGVSDPNLLASVPGWTPQGNVTVVVYSTPGVILDPSIDAGPQNHGLNFFSGGPANTASSLTQTIDVSEEADAVDANEVVYRLSGYLGGVAGLADSALLTADFVGSDGLIASVTLGPVSDSDRDGLTGTRYRSATGMLPPGTRTVGITVTFQGTSGFNNALADNLSFVLSDPVSQAYGANLIVNGNAELGLNDDEYNSDPVLDIPGWDVTGAFTVLAYTDNNAPDPTTTGPAGPGFNYFAGGPSNASSNLFQQIAIAGGAAEIDAGAVSYQLSGYLGGFSSQEDNAVVDITFRDGNGNALANAGIGPVTADQRNDTTQFVPQSFSGAVPTGARVIDLQVTSTRTDGDYNDGYADNLSLILTTSVAPPPLLSPGGIASAASYAAGAVSPGEIVALFGTNLGPPAPAYLTVTDGFVDTELSGVRVLFDGIPAPLIYVTAGQIGAVVPYEVDGETTTSVVVEYQGIQSPALLEPVVGAVPGIFTASTLGTGEGAILNQDLTVNSASNPASVGDVIVIYATGEGATTPAGTDGLINITSYPATVLQVTVTIGGQNAKQNYAGEAPYLVSGVLQVNAVIPPDTPAGAVPVQIFVGGVPSQTGVTVAVQ